MFHLSHIAARSANRIYSKSLTEELHRAQRETGRSKSELQEMENEEVQKSCQPK